MRHPLKELDGSAAITVAILLFLAVNVVFLLLRIPYAAFDSDEFQHIHVAWLIAKGEVLYRDFWEHHGPLYSLINGVIFYITDAAPGLTLAFWFRLISALVTGAIFVITFLIARALRLPAKVALTAVAILSSLIFVQDNGTEVRPDPMQAMFWLAGLLLVFRHFRQQSVPLLLLAGTLFGLSIITNSKAAIGPFSVFVYYILGRRLHHMPWPTVMRDLTVLFVGAFAVFACILGYFYLHDAGKEFLYWNYLWNVLLSLYWLGADTSSWLGTESSLAIVNLKFLVSKQLPFVLLTFAGFIIWVSGLLAFPGQPDRRNGGLLLIVLLGTSVGWALNLYNQFFLMFLPLMAIICSFGLFRLAALVKEKAGDPGTIIVALVVLVFGMNLIFNTFRRTPFSETSELVFQKEFTERLISVTEPAQPVAVLWNTCGGYMFNSNLQYYWAWIPGLDVLAQRASGENPFGRKFVDALENGDVEFIVGKDDWFFAELPVSTRSYVQEKYSYKDCLWTRK